MTAAEREALGLKDAPTQSKRTTKTSSKIAATPSASHWIEALPKIANVKGIGLTLEKLDEAPMAAPRVPVDERFVVKRKRKTKAQAAETETSGLEANGSKSSDVREVERIRFHDEDFAELEWQRFERMLASRSIEADQLYSLYSQAKDNVDARRDAVAIETLCDLCQQDIDLLNPVSYTVCPAPHPELQARTARKHSDHESVQDSTSCCGSVFHLRCLAEHFLRVESGSPTTGSPFLLPTFGRCPSPRHELSGGGMQPVAWADVVRGAYRRRDRLDFLSSSKSTGNIPPSTGTAAEMEDDDVTDDDDEIGPDDLDGEESEEQDDDEELGVAARRRTSDPARTKVTPAARNRRGAMTTKPTLAKGRATPAKIASLTSPESASKASAKSRSSSRKAGKTRDKSSATRLSSAGGVSNEDFAEVANAGSPSGSARRTARKRKSDAGNAHDVIDLT